MEEIVQIFSEHIDRRIAEGFTIICGSFGSREMKRCCAVSSVPGSGRYIESAVQALREKGLDASENQIVELGYGFDDSEDVVVAHSIWREAGLALRAKYSPTTTVEW